MLSENTNVQLYPLLMNLSSYIEHTEYNGLVVAYAIIDALDNFKTNVGSKQKYKTRQTKPNPQTIEQLKFEEMRSIYNKIDEVLDYAKNNGGQAAYSSLAHTVGKNIETILDYKRINSKNSMLLKTIVKNIGPEKNYVDNIRKKGIKLVDLVKFKGTFSRPHDYLTEDYKSIVVSFSSKGA